MLCDSYSTASSFDPPTQNCYYRLLQTSVECMQGGGDGVYIGLSSTLVIFVVCFCVVIRSAYIDIHSSIGDPHNQTTSLLQ